MKTLMGNFDNRIDRLRSTELGNKQEIPSSRGLLSLAGRFRSTVPLDWNSRVHPACASREAEFISSPLPTGPDQCGSDEHYRFPITLLFDLKYAIAGNPREAFLSAYLRQYEVFRLRTNLFV